MLLKEDEHHVIISTDTETKNLFFFPIYAIIFSQQWNTESVTYLLNMCLKATPLNRNYQAAPERGTPFDKLIWSNL